MSDRAIDQELVERVQAGDRKAFDLLVIKYQRKVQRLVSRYIRDSGEIDDVTQETFIKAYRALANFRGESAFYTWIYRIAINCAKNYLASPGRRIVPVSELESDEDEDGESFERASGLQDVATPDAEYASKQIAETVNRAMAALPDDLRTAVTLREIEGLSYEEIAEAMDCPIGTVRSRIFRAREAIAAELRPLLGTREDRRW
jgi:RNA polymerase sigma-70 factor (ECF subfamily)